MLDLVGRREIAERAGTTPALVAAGRRGPPAVARPQGIVPGTPLWRGGAGAAWLARPRPTGRHHVG